MLNFVIFTVSLLVILLLILFIMNKVWKRYTLDELLKKNDEELYKHICDIAEKYELTTSAITLVHYSLVKDNLDSYNSPETTCKNYMDFFYNYFKDPRKGILETKIQDSIDIGRIVEVLNKENIISYKHEKDEFKNEFKEEDLLRGFKA